MNEVVGMNNHIDKSGGNKRLVRPFRRQYFWKYVGFILSAVTYGKR